MENLIIEIGVAHMPIFPKRFVGDSLIAGILFHRNHDWKRAIDEVPIANVEGIPQISVVLPYYSASQTNQNFSYIRNFMRDLNHDRDILEMVPVDKHGRPKMPSKSNMTGKGPFINVENIYAGADLTKVFFIGKGHIDRITDILSSVSFIGSQRNRGHGKVTSLEVYEVETDNPFFGIIGQRHGKNHVLRPIPERLRSLFPSELSYMISNETWHNPYRSDLPTSVVERCIVPSFGSGEYFSSEEIEQELSQLV